MARRVTHLPRKAAPSTARSAHAVALGEQMRLARGQWDRDRVMSGQTRVRVDEILTRYVAWLAVQGVPSFGDALPEHAQGFVLAPTRQGVEPVVATRQTRRTALRMLYRTLRALDLAQGDPTMDLALPPKGRAPARPLTDDEVALCRITAQWSRERGAALRPVIWALGECGAISSEMTAVRICDLDLPAAPRTIALPGTSRHEPRTARLTAWGSRVIGAHVQNLHRAGAQPHDPLAYRGGAQPGGAKAQASACNAVRELMNRAGLIHESDVRPASLRHWMARSAYDSGVPIEKVAQLLGVTSLDTAAENIHLHWRAAATQDGGQR